MFGKRDGDFSPRRFWRWFAREAPGISNAIEALARGEADAEWALIGLNERIRRYDPALEADVIRTLDGHCQLMVSGGTRESIAGLLIAAQPIAGWTFVPRLEQAQAHRVPFRAAPSSSLDTMAAPFSARPDTYAV